MSLSDLSPVYEARDLRISAKAPGGAEIPIVKGVDITVRKGEVVALIGESGSGKTTIALSALGYTKPGLHFAGGSVKLLGTEMTALSTDRLREMRRRKVAYLAQSAAAYFNPSLQIMEQVIEATAFDGETSPDEARQRALQLFRALELPDADRIGDRYPHQVSGGQLQRLMAAMALCGKPDLLVLEEPTTALDVTTQIEVLKTFKKVIREEGASAIYVTHDLAVVAQIADRIVVLYDGLIQEKGTAEEVINRARHPYTRRLMEAVRPPPESGQSQNKPKLDKEGGQILNIGRLFAGYGRVDERGIPRIPILKDITLEVGKGRTVGVIGESGCGKSTLAKVIAGDLPAASGNVRLKDVPLPRSYRDRSKEDLRKIQLVHQNADVALNPRHRVSDIVGRPLSFYFGLRGAELKQRIAALLEQVDLSASFANRFPHELSGGQKQRINLARALASGPELILCDEVTSALDSIVADNVVKLLKRLRQETGVSFVFISHDLSTVASFADEIAVLYAGRLVEYGSTDQVLDPPFHPYTQLLISSVPEMQIGWLENRSVLDLEEAKGVGPDFKAFGCPFHNRCPGAIKGVCDTTPPPRKQNPERPGHFIACHLDFEDFVAEPEAEGSEHA